MSTSINNNNSKYVENSNWQGSLPELFVLNGWYLYVWTFEQLLPCWWHLPTCEEAAVYLFFLFNHFSIIPFVNNEEYLTGG